jgi:hypothetical protein
LQTKLLRIGSILATVVLAFLSIAQALAETPSGACARLGAEETPRPIPASLVPAVNAVFGTSMPLPVAIATTVFRCAEGHVLVCTIGANLPCGSANTSRAPEYGVTAWCHDHPNAAVVPAVATGRDTIFAWRCRNGLPRIDRQVYTVDAHGFVTRYWRILPAG